MCHGVAVVEKWEYCRILEERTPSQPVETGTYMFYFMYLFIESGHSRRMPRAISSTYVA